MNNKTTLILLIVMQTLITFMLSALYAKSIVDEARQEMFDLNVDSVKVKVISIDDISNEIIKMGLSPYESAEYGDLYIQILSKQGYLVIDKNNVVAGVDNYSEKLPSYEAVKATAAAMNVVVTEDYQAILDNSPVKGLIDSFEKQLAAAK